MSIIKVGHYKLNVSHEDKILFPSPGITKGQLIEYYIRVAPYMLPYVKNRPISMQRFPEGIEHDGFYHKDAPDYFPSFIKRFSIPRADGGVVHYVVVNNSATLAYLANHACVTIHAWLSRVDNIMYPDRIIFDLDPSGEDFDMVRMVAYHLRDELMSHNLVSYVMTTGSRGVHIVVPIIRTTIFDTARSFALTIALSMVKKYPQFCTLEMHKDKRKGKVFIDVLRNAFGQTGVAPYSVRATIQASVACPLLWDELSDPAVKPTTFTINNIWERLEMHGDVWSRLEHKKKRLL